MKGVVGREPLGKIGAKAVLDRSDHPGDQRRGANPLLIGKAEVQGQREVGGGHGFALARGGKKQPCSIACGGKPAYPWIGHGKCIDP